MIKKFKQGRARSVVTATLGTLAASVMAATSAVASDVPESALDVLKTASPDVKVEKQFDGPEGLVGFVISEGEGTAPVVVWMTDDHKHLIAGNVFDGKGRNLTKLAADHYDAENPVTLMVSNAVGSALETAIAEAGIRQGQGVAAQAQAESAGEPEQDEFTEAEVAKALDSIASIREAGGLIVEQKATEDRPTVTIFFDPYCPHCKTLHDGMEGMDLQGAGVEWIPVNLFEGPSKAALAVQEGTVKAVKRSLGNTPVLKPIKDQSVALVEANTQVLQKDLLPGTPIAVIDYPDSDERADTALVGPVASDVLEAVSAAGATE